MHLRQSRNSIKWLWALLAAAALAAAGRLPTVFAEPPAGPVLSDRQLQEAEKLMEDPLLRGATVSALVKHLPSGKVVFAHEPEAFCAPASANKLITGAGAFALLGPDYRFKTRVLADRRPDASGAIHGNLYLVGGGDPRLTPEKIWSIAHMLRLLGVRQVTGDLIGDDSFHDATRYYEEWGPQSYRSYKAPLGALSVNYNTVNFWVRPGPKEGAPAIVELDPRPAGLQIQGQIETVAGRVNKTVLTYDGQTANVSGELGVESAPGPARQAVDDPLSFAVGAFRQMLKTEGIAVGGKSTGGVAPRHAALIYEYESDELSLMVRELYRFSNNFMAEQILRTIGAVKRGAPGSRESGAAAIGDWLRQEGLWRDGVVVVDGSGLARDNRQSAASMVGVLEWAARSPRIFPEYLNAQPIAGVDGTLRRRFKHGSLLGRVRAKTGFINGVVSLAGYCYDARGELYAFAVLINDYQPIAGARGPQKLTESLLEVLMM
jgi:D-alanyl-D-alanine carboxypeptidase/D-alanyl-D-alanine-endopeptidase (penicillin-binding protein 4)